MFSSIVLIGPFGVGKTTVGRLIAEKTGLPQVSLDDLCYAYYQEIGWSSEEAKRIYTQNGDAAYDDYINSFEPYGVEQVLARHDNCVIDLGGSHTLYDDQKRIAHVQEVLAPYPNVVLLLPSASPEESVRVLRTRWCTDFLEYSVRHLCNFLLAKHIVYVEGRSPEQIRDEVLERTQFSRFCPSTEYT